MQKVSRTPAQGTLLWVGFCSQIAGEMQSDRSKKKALDPLSTRGWNELYARMLLQIDLGRRDIAATIFR